MKPQRPVNLDLMTIKFPITAIASILHRISGILLFIAVPILLCLLDRSLASADDFAQTHAWLMQPLVKLGIWLISAAIFYHLFAGIRHMVMDLGYGESLEAGRRSVKMVIGLTVLAWFITGYWLW